LKPISIQLYTLRKDVYPGGDDLPGVIRTVADIGYKGVEFAGLQGNDPKDIRKLMDDLGIKCSSSHCGIPTKENVAQIADQELTLGNTRAVGGWGPDDLKTIDGVKKACAALEEAAELLKPYGMTVGFHNHEFEFALKIDGKRVYDIMLAEAPHAFSELDLYWCAWGKSDPVETVKQYKSRLPLLHVKDGMLEVAHPHVAVGDGKLDFPAIFGATDPNVTEWYIVELDAYDGPMIDPVKKSYQYLVSNGLAAGNK